MTQGFPGTWPQSPQIQPVVVEAAQPVVDDDSGLWLGLTVLGGGVVATLGLLAWATVSNNREHDEIRSKLNAADRELYDYRVSMANYTTMAAEENARQHAMLQAQITQMQSVPSTRVPVQSVMASAPATVYGEPYFSQSYPSVSAFAPTQASLPVLAPASVPVSVRTLPIGSMTPGPALPFAVPSAPAPASRVASLPPHVESAVNSAMSRSRTLPAYAARSNRTFQGVQP